MSWLQLGEDKTWFIVDGSTLKRSKVRLRLGWTISDLKCVCIQWLELGGNRKEGEDEALLKAIEGTC